MTDKRRAQTPQTASNADLDQAAAMRLRGPSPRVTRLSRRVLAGLGAVGLVTIGGALVFALEGDGRLRHRSAPLTINHHVADDALQALPRDYTSVPQLGPPLPGDLGRPILNSRTHGSLSSGRLVDDTGQRRRLQDMEAARTSKLFARVRAGPRPSAATPALSSPRRPSSLVDPGLSPGSASKSHGDLERAFLNRPAERKTISTDRVQAPTSPDILQAGSVIPAALMTGIRSDLPGQITAQVTENVHDSPTGRILLIPQGTRLIGEYDNDIAFGQRRVLLVWTRMIFPNGSSILLDRQPGADPEGYAGLEGSVDFHWGALFKAAALSTILSLGAEAGIQGQQSAILRALRQGASESISQTGRQIVGRQLDLAPTLAIRPGTPVRVMVTRDLVLEPYGGRQ